MELRPNVLRGVWILENLLGTPPSPPPPDIEPIEPDTRGVATIRELMVKHRENATCFECHRKIDPLGLSLETYDFLGRWRENYSKAPNRYLPEKCPTVLSSMVLMASAGI